MNIYKKALIKLILILTRCLNCSKFPCKFIREELHEEEYGKCLNTYKRLLKKIENIDEVDRLLYGIVSRIVPSGFPTLDKIIKIRYSILNLCLNNTEDILTVLLHSLGIGLLSKYLLDSSVEDIYITESGIYIIYRGFKICRVKVPPSELNRLLDNFMYLANISGNSLSFDEPSTIFSLNIENIIRMRVSIDVWPCVSEKVVHLRIHRRPLTVYELARYGMFNLSMIRTVINYLRNRYNLLIIGPPCSGKTTLLNALLLEFVKHRKNIKIVCIDEADELWIPDDVLVIKYRSIYGRVREIEKVLHRGGGMLVIGELREKDHYDAYGIAINSGLQVLSTVHGYDVDDVVSKFKHYGDPLISHKNRLIVICLSFSEGIRRVSNIYVGDLSHLRNLYHAVYNHVQ